MQQRRRELRYKVAATSEKGEDVRQDLQEDHKSRDRKVNNRVFDCAAERKWLNSVEGSVVTDVIKDTSRPRPSK
jgi:dephospho-CoA kinase